MGFPGGPMVKNLPDHAGATWDAALIPESGRSPKGGNGQLTPAFLPGKFHRQRSLPGLVHGVTKSRTWLSDQACMQHLKILGNITWNENACFQSTVLSEILGLAHLPSELSAVFASITRWANFLDKPWTVMIQSTHDTLRHFIVWAPNNPGRKRTHSWSSCQFVTKPKLILLPSQLAPHSIKRHSVGTKNSDVIGKASRLRIRWTSVPRNHLSQNSHFFYTKGERVWLIVAEFLILESFVLAAVPVGLVTVFL